MPADWANTATLEEVPSLPQSYCWIVGTILKTCIDDWDGGEGKSVTGAGYRHGSSRVRVGCDACDGWSKRRRRRVGSWWPDGAGRTFVVPYSLLHRIPRSLPSSGSSYILSPHLVITLALSSATQPSDISLPTFSTEAKPGDPRQAGTTANHNRSRRVSNRTSTSQNALTSATTPYPCPVLRPTESHLERRFFG